LELGRWRNLPILGEYETSASQRYHASSSPLLDQDLHVTALDIEEGQELGAHRLLPRCIPRVPLARVLALGSGRNVIRLDECAAWGFEKLHAHTDTILNDLEAVLVGE
jgi:hypothetical protein